MNVAEVRFGRLDEGSDQSQAFIDVVIIFNYSLCSVSGPQPCPSGLFQTAINVRSS